MNRWHSKRANNASKILRALKKYEKIYRIPKIEAYMEHAWYKLNVFLNVGAIKQGLTNNDVIKKFNEAGINCFAGPCPEIYREEAFKEIIDEDFELENAKLLGETSIMFLVHPTLADLQLKKICKAIDLISGEIIK